MEFRQLQYVIQIAAEKNFSRAAEKLHIAQPSLSQQLSKLEKEIGVLLFRRSTNSVELTHAGAAFVEQAQKIIDAAEQLKLAMADISNMRKGKLVVGSLPITGSHILPLVLPVFARKYPNIEIALVEDTTNNLEALTSAGKTDLSLLTLPLLEQSLTYQTLIQEEICLAVPHSHPLAEIANRLPVDVSSLKDEPFIVLKRGQGFRQITLDLCEEAGFSPRVVFESSNIETVQSLVAAGMGVGFVPHMMTRSQSGDFIPAYLRLASRNGSAPSRTLVIASRKGRYLSKAAEAFIATLMDVMKEYETDRLGGNP
ncbi:transcriptional regulator [Paenibacillus swuensis]|uniref:Transcriptional regulator n=1 Tax=Paenibacillus swuensis TaxID=1178515 RepID=A0A172TLS1_9BACL|nr:LysR family transcriptional regulator [Paenibacillus swuensis]ANE47916.1 transcriptional regulator [Paenibacillus swuensis]